MYRGQSYAKRKSWKKFNQNDGVPGVVYILENAALRENYFKIGCSRHSGEKRAFSLNKAAATGMPAEYRCVFEQETLDCGLAEKRVFAVLEKFRRGKWGQEFFELDLELARDAVVDGCYWADQQAMEKERSRFSDRKKRRGASPLEAKLVRLSTVQRQSRLQMLCWAVIGLSLISTIAAIVLRPLLP